MPNLDKYFARGGMRLSNFVVSTGVCCPARTSYFTGQLAHCNNVTGNAYDFMRGAGGFRKFWESKLDRRWLPTLLESAGYENSLAGKFLNYYYENASYFPANYRYKPLGFKSFDATTYRAYNQSDTCYSLNGAPCICHTGVYQTETLAQKARDVISSAAASRKPFFLTITPTAPHLAQDDTPGQWFAPEVQEQYRSLYAGEGVTVPKGANWMVAQPNIPRKQQLTYSRGYEAGLNSLYLARLRSLRSVDDMIDSIMTTLKDQGLLDNTYILYGSDNGFHLGAFGLNDGKNTPIEDDVRVPFFIRGPGITPGSVLPYQANMVDLAPTFLALAGLPIPDYFDGLPLPLMPRLQPAYATALGVTLPPGVPGPVLRDANILEGWNGDYIPIYLIQNSLHYKGVRICSGAKLLPDPAPGAAGGRDLMAKPGFAANQVYAPGTYCYKYTVWCQGNKELYDMSTDPYEINNQISTAPSRLLDRLDAVLSTLVHCRGAECRNPYRLLHKDGAVWDFAGTMATKYDTFYRTLPKLQLTECNVIYLPRKELTWRNPAGTFTS
ncbi:hypothetical protein HYH03_003065 [Edaphochlamys debaryana]|uniref:Sulfatase N-terminal domain-containing protein n=1 Tax=Edaphochlamys debaryana TaxID=47281 RepID=A0A835YA40_9CHLO|nr:hypothetical protein HYH03_003065 [Edaphochlamys debaryana]|eukprot:KAG2498873.1 hypothetical protein HYH03_003065 [Edaphochlamys debaryana]